MQYLLGIDVGTSVVKSVLFDLQGREVVVSRRIPAIIRERQGWSEMSMEALWQDVVATLREVAVSDALTHGEIAGIGVSGTCCSSWLLNADGQPVRNAILWNDGRAGNRCSSNRNGRHYRLRRYRLFATNEKAEVAL